VQRGGQCEGLVELDEVACVLDELEPGAGDEAGQAVRPVDGYPPVLLTPDDQGRDRDAGVERLDGIGKGLVGLGDLALKSSLAGRPKPGRGKVAGLVSGQASVARAGDVGAQRSGVNGCGQPCKHVVVVADQSEELGATRSQRHHVNQSQRREPGAVQKVSA